MAGLIQADGILTVTQVITLYNCGEQKSISECASDIDMDGFQQLRTTLDSTSISQGWKAEAGVCMGLKTGQLNTGKNITLSNESYFLLGHTELGTKSMNPWVNSLSWWRRCNGVRIYFLGTLSVR